MITTTGIGDEGGIGPETCAGVGELGSPEAILASDYAFDTKLEFVGGGGGGWREGTYYIVPVYPTYL